MKLHTAAFAALTGLGLCVAPAAFAQSSATDKSAVETKVKAMEDKWEAAEMEKDHGASTVGEMLASDYNGVGSKGEMRTKSSQLEHMKADTDTYSSAKNDKLDVHVYSPDVATVVGMSSEKGTDKDGKQFDRKFAWIDTWMQRDGKWECIASSGAPVEKK